MRAVLLTSTFRRHNFVANYLARHCDLVGVWQEVKTFVPARYAATPDDDEVIRRHFDARDRAEEACFAADADVRVGGDAGVNAAVGAAVGPAVGAAEGASCRRVEAGACNQPAEVALMQQLRPDVVLVFGTGILRGAVLEAFGGRLINIHLGLSPYYRGAGTNFWPLVNGEPEYVGATIHYLDAGIDTGPIIAHARPQIRPADGPHDIGNRAIVQAAETLLQAARGHVAGVVGGAVGGAVGDAMRGVAQGAGGRLYQRKDFSAEAVRRLYRNFKEGMIPRYLAEREQRDARLNLVELPRVA